MNSLESVVDEDSLKEVGKRRESCRRFCSSSEVFEGYLKRRKEM